MSKRIKVPCIDCKKSCCKTRCLSCETKRRHKVGVLNNKGKYNAMFGRKRLEHSKRMTGNGNSNWKGGSTPVIYPLGWTKTYKEQIRYLNNYRCQICDCHEVECTRKLHVHHIDYNKNNLKKNNLVSVCHSCHMKTNGNRQYWIDYFTNKVGVLYGN